MNQCCHLSLSRQVVGIKKHISKVSRAWTKTVTFFVFSLLLSCRLRSDVKSVKDWGAMSSAGAGSATDPLPTLHNTLL